MGTTDERRTKSLADAIAEYLWMNPGDAGRAPYYLGLTVWAHGIYGGHPTLEESRDAVEELGRKGEAGR